MQIIRGLRILEFNEKCLLESGVSLHESFAFMNITHLRILLFSFWLVLMACKPSPPQLETDLAALVLTATEKTNRLDTLQQRIKVNRTSLDFALQPDIAADQSPSSDPAMLDPLAQLPNEQKTQIQLQVLNLSNEWKSYMEANNDLLESLSATTNQIVRIKNQIDQGSIKIRPDGLADLSASMLELEKNLNLLETATLDCHNRTLIFLSENPGLARGAAYLQSKTQELQQ